MEVFKSRPPYDKKPDQAHDFLRNWDVATFRGYAAIVATSPHPRKLASGRVSWSVQFRLNGKVTRESFTPIDDSEAEGTRAHQAAVRFAKLVDTVGGEAASRTRNARQQPSADMPTLEAWTATYLDPTTGHLSGVTPGTRQGYRDIAARSFLRVLGEMPIDVIRKQDIARWVAWQEAQPSHRSPGQTISSKTVKNYHGTLSAVLAAAVDARLIDYNPARGTRLTRGIKTGGIYLTVPEFERLVAAMPEFYRPLATWLVYTGMRWGEATALTWGDLDWHAEPPTARVTKAWQKGPTRTPILGPPKTDKSRRTIVVNWWVIDQLGASGRADELVFKGIRSGERLWWSRFYKSAWVPAVAKVNEEPRKNPDGTLVDPEQLPPMGKHPKPHDLRHTHASWLIADQVSPHVIQYRLGHESITTTYDRYGHLMADAHVQVMESLETRRPAGLREVVAHEVLELVE